jgi:Ca-activated chloride channel family protein
MAWAASAYAWLLLLALPGWLLLRRANQRRERDLLRLSGEGRGQVSGSTRAWRRLGWWLQAIASVLIIAALCRPQWGQVPAQQHSRGIDILVALDVSRSMLADDMKPNRLAAAKRSVTDLLPKLGGNRVGLIAFAGSAFMVCPLTTDYETFANVLLQTDPDSIPLGGTSLAGVLNEAKRAFGEKGGKGGVLIVISDGEDHGSDITAATDALHTAGVTVHTVSVGTATGGLIPLPDGQFLKSREGTVVRSRRQVEPLRTLAAGTGGRQLDLAADPKALEQLLSTEGAAQAWLDREETRSQLEDRFQIPLAVALLLLLIEPVIGRRGQR